MLSTRALPFISLSLFSVLATAAPFCAVTGSGTNCWYYDAQSCRQAAGTGGACVVNPSEVQFEGGTRQRPGIRFGTVAPAIESYNRNMQEADRQRAEDRALDLRQLEIEQRQQDLVIRNTDPRLLPLSPDQGISLQTHSLIMSAVMTSLEMNAPGTAREWRNLQTGSYGSVFPKVIVQNMFGEPCREFSISLTDKRGETRITTGTACRKNGNWVWLGG